jgi:hypothetical protein
VTGSANDDRHTYRLDPETLRWAAEQVTAA